MHHEGQKRYWISGTGIRHCELPDAGGRRELNSDSLQEQHLLYALFTGEPPLQLQLSLILNLYVLF